MKKSITAIIFLLISVSGFTQEKKDTVLIPVYEKYDTTRAVILYPGENYSVKYTPGYVIVKGFATKKEGKWYWEKQPAIHMVLDEKRKQLKEWIQIL